MDRGTLNSMNDRDTRELIKRVLDGNQGSTREFVDQYRRLVASVVASWNHDQEDIQDISQEVFIKVFRNLHHFRFQASLTTWISRITVNECRLHYRKNRRRMREKVLEPEREQDPSMTGRAEHRVEGKDLMDRLDRLLETQPPAMKLLFRLRFIEQMDSTRIGKIMQLPSGTVRRRTAQLRTWLAEKLDWPGGEK